MEQLSSFSWTRGVSFCFVEAGHNVEAWYSSISGLERLSIDSEVVCLQRNFSTDSTNTFYLQDVEYSVRLQAKSLIKGPYIFEVLREGDVCQRQKVVFHFVKLWLRLAIIFPLVIIGAVIEYVFSLPVLSNYFFMGAVFFLVVAYDFKTHPPTIEYISLDSPTEQPV